jgi:hypothetical protein
MKKRDHELYLCRGNDDPSHEGPKDLPAAEVNRWMIEVFVGEISISAIGSPEVFHVLNPPSLVSSSHPATSPHFHSLASVVRLKDRPFYLPKGNPDGAACVA